METENQIHLSIDNLAQIVDQARSILEENPKMSNIIRLTKTSFRQTGDASDTVALTLLPSCTKA